MKKNKKVQIGYTLRRNSYISTVLTTHRYLKNVCFTTQSIFLAQFLFFWWHKLFCFLFDVYCSKNNMCSFFYMFEKNAFVFQWNTSCCNRIYNQISYCEGNGKEFIILWNKLWLAERTGKLFFQRNNEKLKIMEETEKSIYEINLQGYRNWKNWEWN